MTTQLSQRVLDFFNQVTDPWDIRYRILDDPNFGAGGRSYGISLTKAKNIIDNRNTLPGKKITSLSEIDGVSGIGSVTMHNILYSFNKTEELLSISGEKNVRIRGDFLNSVTEIFQL